MALTTVSISYLYQCCFESREEFTVFGEVSSYMWCFSFCYVISARRTLSLLFQKVKDKQCLRTVEKFKSVVKDMLREAAPEATASQSQIMDETAVTDITQGSGVRENNKEMDTEGTTVLNCVVLSKFNFTLLD